jgi:phosphoribosylpyrophosphate synthetase
LLPTQPGSEGKTCIVVDDIADTAETLCQAADKLKAQPV